MIERELYAKIKPYLDSTEAIVITGMRRVGKTTLLHFIYDEIDASNKLYLDLENPLHQKYFEHDDFEEIKRVISLEGIDFSKRCYLFLDEIQWVKRMPNIVKYLIDHYQVKFFLTGSASFYLKNLFSESLAGRKYIFELFPLSFKEFLLLKGERTRPPVPGERVLEAQYTLLMRYYREYFEYGGFPQVIAKTSAEDKKRSFDDIFSSYFQLEVERLGDFRKVHVVRDLILLLAARSGSMLDVSKLSSELGVSRPTIYEYLSFLEGTYFIHIVRPWSKSRDVAIRKAVKLYVCDAGLARHLGGASEGTLFETNVFQQLRLKGDICYYRKKSGAEIDFIINKDTAYEAKMKASEHEVKRLAILSKELGLREQSVVSYAYGEKGNVLYPFQLSAE